MDDSRGRANMWVHRASIRFAVIGALTAVTLLTISASGQSTATQSGNANKETVATQGSRSDNQENKVADDAPKPGDLESQVAAVKAENAAFRESVRKMEEQQKALLELVDRLQRRLDGIAIADVSRTTQPSSPAPVSEASASSTD